jgi:superfamily II RNA helicase
VCLGKDNRWYVVTVADVKQLRGEIPRIAAVDSLSPPPEMPLKPGQSRKGTEETAAIARQITFLADDPDDAPEVHTQLQRMQDVEAQIQAHPVSQWGNRATILKRQKRISAIQEELSDRKTKLDRQSHRYWEAFMDLITILEEFACVEWIDQQPKPTSAGESVAAIRGDNELWLGMALMSGELDGLEPHHFAAACSALVTEVSRPDSWSRYDPPRLVEEALGGLRHTRHRLFQKQNRLKVALPVWLEYDFVGLVEQWALGGEWNELCSNTSLDEGDVVRILRRTLDFLSQIPHIPHLPGDLKRNAIRAIQLCDRFPVSGDIE